MTDHSHASYFRLAVLAYAAITIAAAVSAWAFARREVNRVNLRSAETFAMQQKLADARDLLSRFQAEVASRRASGAISSAAANLLPADQQSEAFLKEVNAASAHRGVQIPSVQSQPPVRDEKMARIIVQLMCRGSFHALHAFLNDVERGAAAARIESLSMRQDNSGVCTMEITCVVYGR